MKILLKFYKKNGEMIKHSFKGYSRRISQIISHANFKVAYLKVSYGKKICNKDCVCEFYNDGFYENSDTLKKALDAFRKED